MSHFQARVNFEKNQKPLVNNSALLKEDYVATVIAVIACINNYDKCNSSSSLYFKLGGCDQKPNFDSNIDLRIFKMNAFLKLINDSTCK